MIFPPEVSLAKRFGGKTNSASLWDEFRVAECGVGGGGQDAVRVGELGGQGELRVAEVKVG